MNWTHEFLLSSPLDVTAAAAQELPEYCAKDRAARNQGRRNFCGNTTYTEAAALAETGWIDAPRLDLLAEQIAPTETRTAHEMHHAVSGAFVDVSRYIEGHPEDMIEYSDEPAPRSLSIAAEIGKNAGTSTRSMELAGAVALAVIDTLARAGIAADLYGYATSIRASTKSVTRFPIRRANEPADQNQLAFWLCHPAAFRSLVFGFWDTCPKDFYHKTEQDAGRGRPEPSTAEALGVDYVLSTSPQDERQAAAEYRRIIAEIQNTL